MLSVYSNNSSRYVKHVQVLLYQSVGVARGEFSTPVFTSRSFLGETKCKKIVISEIDV
jgi:hypothetical protein